MMTHRIVMFIAVQRRRYATPTPFRMNAGGGIGYDWQMQ